MMDTNRKRYPFLLFITILIYVIFGLLTSVIGVVIDRFQADYHVSLTVAALLPFAFYLAYGITSLPFGVLMEKVGAKPVLLLGTALMAMGSFLCYFSHHYMAVIIAVFLIGIGVTGVQIAGNPFIRVLDAPSKYTANLTMVIGIGALGYALSPVIVPIMQDNGFSWKAIYLLIAFLNVAILLILSLVKFPVIQSSASERINFSKMRVLFRHPIIITYGLAIFLYVGAEVGVSSYIITFMGEVHGLGNADTFWGEHTMMHAIFPSITALVVALFWFLQAIGRLIASSLMKYVSERKLFIFHSACTIVALLFAILGDETTALVSFAVVGYFTCISFTSIYSAVINSFDRDHGVISGFLGTAIIGGAVVGWLVGFTGQHWGMRWGMSVNIVAFLYVLLIAVLGKGRLDVKSN